MSFDAEINRRTFLASASKYTLGTASLFFENSKTANAAAKESEIKAAFLTNFFNYIIWPNTNNTNNTSKTICIAGDDELLSILERAISKRSPESQPTLKPIKITQPTELQISHLLYIDRTITKQEQWLAKAKGMPILSVGETDNFLSNGGIIRFLTIEDRLRFDINRTQAESIGFQISTKLLKLARELI